MEKLFSKMVNFIMYNCVNEIGYNNGKLEKYQRNIYQLPFEIAFIQMVSAQ